MCPILLHWTNKLLTNIDTQLRRRKTRLIISMKAGKEQANTVNRPLHKKDKIV